MNNIEKNTYVKKQITNALLSLLKSKELKDISISEVTSAAGVSRVSFYRNYKEKEDILREYIKRQLTNWMNDNNKQDSSGDESLGNIFAYLTEYKDIYLLLSRRNLLYLLKDIIMETFGPKPDHRDFDAYTAAFVANGIYGWIEEWFIRGMQESGEEMTILLKNRNMNA